MSWKQAVTALKYPNYRLWFWSQIVSLFGTWMEVDGPRLPRLRPDQVPGLPRAGRLRHRASRPGCSCSTPASSPTGCRAGPCS
ncbi:MAG: hypothetical protein M0C28_35800 [Candidatus Moduliflexus flocculans]|nr:hypothetical protein [Candidatus Moduliflexus flocculans]